jgi:hypothetical protein
MEFLLVMAFVFLILVGIMLVAYTQSARFTNDVTASQIQKVGNEIIDAANAAYYAGPPTKKTITLYFPQQINTITIAGQSIIFNLQGSGGSYDYVVYSSSNLTGSLRTFSGLHTITITIVAQEGAVSVTD